jgi:DegV family protein with EDD domain
MPKDQIAIVTDSTADIPDALLENHSIQVVPAVMVIGDRSYEDGVEISREAFYKNLPAMNPLPTTGIPSLGKFQNAYEKALSGTANRVISIHPSSTLSGLYQTACAAAQAFEGRVHVIDSHFLTLGLGFQCLEAAEAARQGASHEETIQVIEDARKRARVIAMLDTLEYVRRSGRVSWAKARLGNLLNLKPFIEVRDGKINQLGESRTRRKGIERLIGLIAREAPFQRLAILHTNAEAEARQLLADLNPTLPTEPFMMNITPIIGAHVGPNGLGFAGLTL